MVVLQFTPPPITWARTRIIGEIPWTSLACRSRTLASSMVSRLKLPQPWLTPPTLRAAGKTMSRLAPKVWILSRISFCAPSPIATMIMTAATPMIMPSEVRKLRIRFFSMLRKETLIVFCHLIAFHLVDIPAVEVGLTGQ